MAQTNNSSRFSIAIWNGGARDFIKIIAAVLMVLDHMAFAGMINPLFHSALGRGVYPIFAYSLGCFLATNPPSIRKYVVKMALFAILTQPVYAYFMGQVLPGRDMLNVLFTLLFAIVLGRLLLSQSLHPFLRHSTLVILLLGDSAIGLPIEYGLVGIVMPVLFGFVMQGKQWGMSYLLLCFFMLNAPDYELISINWFLSSALVMAYTACSFYAAYRLSPYLADDFGLRKRFLNKHFLYVFYPFHILVLALLK